MEFFDLVKRRRSIRKYQDRQIERGDLEKIIQAGLCAPNAGGGTARDHRRSAKPRALRKNGRLNIAKIQPKQPGRLLRIIRTAQHHRRPLDPKRILRRPHGLRGFRAEEFSVQRCGRLLLCRKHGSGRHGTGACLLSDRTRRRNLRQRTGGRAFEGMADPGRICCTLLRAFGVPCGSLSAGQAPKGRPQPGRRMRWAYGCTDLFEKAAVCRGAEFFHRRPRRNTAGALYQRHPLYFGRALFFHCARKRILP